MLFTVRCPFCKAEMDCPDDVLGQVGQCVSCGHEIDLEPVGGSLEPTSDDDPAAREVRTMRAAALASIPSEMPRVTWSWAFSFVWKISIAVAAIDGIIWFVIWLVLFLIDRHNAAERNRMFQMYSH